MKIFLTITTVIIIPIAILTILFFFIASIVADRSPAKPMEEGKVIYPHIASWEDDLYAV